MWGGPARSLPAFPEDGREEAKPSVEKSKQLEGSAGESSAAALQ